MGNCLRHDGSSSVTWGGEDWDYLASNDRGDHNQMAKMEEEEEDGLLGGENGKVGSYDSSSTTLKIGGGGGGGGPTEVKVKMTKKQLEELMGRVELKQMTVQQVLAQLIMTVSSNSDPYETDHQQPWRPVLQSIPEVN